MNQHHLNPALTLVYGLFYINNLPASQENTSALGPTETIKNLVLLVEGSLFGYNSRKRRPYAGWPLEHLPEGPMNKRTTTVSTFSGKPRSILARLKP
ncbi:MAG: hypothetical protein WAV20_07875 [Blastocatellia bacterium]